MKTILVMSLVMASMAFAAESDLDSRAAGKAQDSMEACKDDKLKFCDKNKDKDPQNKCLLSHKDKLSTVCKTALGIK